MSSQRDSLLFFQNGFNFLIINIFEATIIFGHDRFDPAIIPCRQIAMKLIILTKHFYFFGILLMLILSLEILLWIIIIIIILELDVCGWDGLIQNFIDLFPVIEILSWWILSIQWMRYERCVLFYIFGAEKAVTWLHIFTHLLF